jgi:hypothetical protein
MGLPQERLANLPGDRHGINASYPLTGIEIWKAAGFYAIQLGGMTRQGIHPRRRS